MKESRKATGFSFSPEVIQTGPNGEHMVADAAHYVLFISHTNGQLAYVPKENKYYISEGNECKPARLKELMPYLRWEFDELEEEVIKGVKTGRLVSKFPPTPENIELKRQELMKGETLTVELMKTIHARTAPNQLLENETFTKYLNEVPEDVRLARRLANQTRF